MPRTGRPAKSALNGTARPALVAAPERRARMADLTDGEKDLRGGTSLWEAQNRMGDGAVGLGGHARVEICIVGAGITGAFLAEEFSRRGMSVLVLDRRGPQRGSTAASTSLLQWELDSPLLELADRIGFEAAAAVYGRSCAAVERIAGLVAGLGIPCDFARRDTLYLAGDSLDPGDLREELDARRHAGLAGEFLDAGGLRLLAGIEADAALLSEGSAEADPVALARGLLAAALRRGARLAAPVTATDYVATSRGVEIATDTGFEVSARHLVLATGYEMPGFVPADRHRIVSTWALASEPMPAESLWPSRALVWQASEPYLYMRTTADGRIVAGGEDEDFTDAAQRDALTGAKVAAIAEKLGRLLPGRRIAPAYGWSGFFGATEDSMPLIGPVPGMRNCFAAFGYGGNGITFSAIGAEMLGRHLAGESDPQAATFALDCSP